MLLCRVEGLQIHYDLEVCQHRSSTDVSELRAHRRQWQRRLNSDILNITLELIVNVFRSVFLKLQDSIPLTFQTFCVMKWWFDMRYCVLETLVK